MSVFISIEGSVAAAVIRVDGWLENSDSTELMKVVRATPNCVALDVVGLDTADARGISVLSDLRKIGIELRGVSDYIELLLARAVDQPKA